MSTLFEETRLRPVTVCGREIPRSTHICAFFESDKEQYECLVPYFAEGLEQGEQVITIRDADALDDHLDRLARLNLPVRDFVRSNQFRPMASEETYLQDGHFGVERMFRMIETALRE